MDKGSDLQYLFDSFLRTYAAFNPVNATMFGWREFAGIVPDASLEAGEAYTAKLKEFRNKAEKIDKETLSEDERLDLLLLINKIDADLFDTEVMETYKYNPVLYAMASFVFDYILKNYAPFEERMGQMTQYFRGLPKLYKQAVSNLDDNLAPELVQMGMMMTQGGMAFLSNLENEINDVSPEDWAQLSEEVKQNLLAARDMGLGALQGYFEYLQKVLPTSTRSFRLGKEKFEKMLMSNERVGLDVAEILAAGEKQLEKELEEMRKAASQIDPSKTVEEITKEMQSDHPPVEKLFSTTESMLEEIRQFLIDADFVSIPSEVRPKVIPTPKPMREWAFAACDTPGALERFATDSYYYVTPPDPSWTEQEQKEWMGVFNYPQLRDISVHEVWPGHYLHHLHNQRSKSLMSKLFGAYHFWEGYALHVEEAMYQAGFYKDDAKYRVGQLSETLLRYVRLVCSIKLHTDPEFTVEDATQLFMTKGFYGRKAAESEAKRGTFDPGYLNYALGKMMIEKLKDDFKAERLAKGEEFSNRIFYDKLLSYGAPPIPILREFMLEKNDGVLFS